MMKKPEDIKKGLEIAVNGCLPCDRLITDCPYDLECRPTSKDTNVDIPKQMAADAIAYIQQLENHIGELTEKVEQLEAAQPRWISVNDRLPEHENEYLVCLDDGFIATTAWSGGDWELWADAGDVTNWRELPAPPKEGE